MAIKSVIANETSFYLIPCTINIVHIKNDGIPSFSLQADLVNVFT